MWATIPGVSARPVTDLCTCRVAVQVGASGAIFGMFGALWAEMFQNWHLMEEGKWKQVFFLTLSTVINLGIGLLPFIDNFAHLFGMLGGFLLGCTVLIRYVPV